MLKIRFLILYFQAINLAICWDLNSPLILNKKEDKVFFPNFVRLLVDYRRTSSELSYKSPDEKAASTYTFCRDVPTPPQGFLGKLLSDEEERSCPSPVDSFVHMYTREQVKDTDENPVPCKAGEEENEVIGWQYKVYFKVQIDGKTYIQNSYDYCYAQGNLNTLYAHYYLENPSLLNNKYLSEERNYDFRLGRANYPDADDVDILDYYEKQEDYVPYEVAISAFIPLGHWRISFHQWHNKAPMHISLHHFWTIFIRNIRSKLANIIEPVKILSGIHGLLRSQDSTMHVSDNKITIPKVWWIVLYNNDKSQGTALIMHNYDTTTGAYAEPEPWCKESKCNDAGLKDVMPERYEHKIVMYCCSAADVAVKVRISEEILSPTNDLLIFP